MLVNFTNIGTRCTRLLGSLQLFLGLVIGSGMSLVPATLATLTGLTVVVLDSINHLFQRFTILGLGPFALASSRLSRSRATTTIVANGLLISPLLSTLRLFMAILAAVDALLAIATTRPLCEGLLQVGHLGFEGLNLGFQGLLWDGLPSMNPVFLWSST